MRIVGVDTNSFYLALTAIKDGRYVDSALIPDDGPLRREDHNRAPTSKKKLFENRSPRERLDVMVDGLEDYIRGFQEFNGAVASGPDDPIEYAYIEEPPFVNSVKTFADLTAVVSCVRQVFRSYSIPVVLVNVSTWKRETTGNAKADKTEVRQWVQAHAGMPDGLTEDEYDAGCIAFRGAVAAGDVR